jgi:hypothetical protein
VIPFNRSVDRLLGKLDARKRNHRSFGEPPISNQECFALNPHKTRCTRNSDTSCKNFDIRNSNLHTSFFIISRNSETVNAVSGFKARIWYIEFFMVIFILPKAQYRNTRWVVLPLAVNHTVPFLCDCREKDSSTCRVVAIIPYYR